MRRWIARIAFFLLMGVAANLSVAWSLALFPPPMTALGGASNPVQAHHVDFDVEKRISFLFTARRGPGAFALDAFAVREVIEELNEAGLRRWRADLKEAGAVLAPCWSVARAEHFGRMPVRTLSDGDLCDRAFGWPFLSMRAEMLAIPLQNAGTGRAIRIRGGMLFRSEADTGTKPIAYPGDRYRILPLIPIWSGFVSGTLLYGGAFFLLWFIPRSARWLIRRVRGRCPACGYDLRGMRHAACPECGRPQQ